MAARVGDDAMGRFLTETLAREGCDVSHVSVDPARLTAAVVLGIKDRDTFPLIFYRENCADMAVTEDDVAEDFLAQSKALLITGTHFSTAARASREHDGARARARATTCARCSTSTTARCCGGSPSAATARRASSPATR